MRDERTSRSLCIVYTRIRHDVYLDIGHVCMYDLYARVNAALVAILRQVTLTRAASQLYALSNMIVTISNRKHSGSANLRRY